MKYKIISLFGVLSLGSLPAWAQDAGTRPVVATTTKNLAEFSVPDFVGVNCEERYKGTNNFLWGLCEQDQLTTNRVAGRAYFERLDKTIRILAQSQQEGLPVRQQNLATLFEGFVHCEKAKAFWDGRKMIPSPNGTGNEVPDDYSLTGFCTERTRAAGSFADVRFNDLLVNKTYKDNAGAEKTNTAFAEDLINRMASCQREVVAEFNRCGQLTPQPLVTVVEKARESTQTELVSYFGCTDAEYKREIDAKRPGDPPGKCETLSGTAVASAMFARKVNRLKLVTDGAGDKLKILDSKAAKLEAQLQQYLSVYAPARDEVSQAFAAFQAASLMTDNIFKEYELWRAGLLGPTAMADLTRRTEQLTADQTKVINLASTMDANVRRMGDLLVPIEVKREHLVELCRLNYCGLWNKNMFAVATAACKKTSMATNTACTGTITLEGSSKTIAEICSGLPASYRVKNLLPPATRTCMEPVVTRNKGAAPSSHSMFNAEL